MNHTRPQEQRGAQELEKIQTSLDVLFKHLDNSRFLHEVIPKVVNAAFDNVVRYFTPCLRNAVTIFECMPLSRFCSAEELYNFAWSQLWRYGKTIKQRNTAGVLAWLSRVIHNCRIGIMRKYSNEIRLMISFHQNNDDDEENARIHKHKFMEIWADDPEDYEYRFELLYDFYLKALAQLNARQRDVIELSSKCTLAEIKNNMGFTSVDAVKAFKRRTLRTLGEKILQMFERELNHGERNDYRKQIIAEWRERFRGRGKH